LRWFCRSAGRMVIATQMRSGSGQRNIADQDRAFNQFSAGLPQGVSAK
jgi:hypothetical protein